MRAWRWLPAIVAAIVLGTAFICGYVNSALVVAFAVAGAIVWPQALWMMVWATLGGWAGARLAKRLPMAWVRAIVIVTGVVMTALFALK